MIEISAPTQLWQPWLGPTFTCVGLKTKVPNCPSRKGRGHRSTHRNIGYPTAVCTPTWENYIGYHRERASLCSIGDEVISWVKKSYHTRHYSMWNFARLCLLIKKSAFSLLTLSCGGTSISTGCLQIKPRVYYARVVQKCNVHFGYISLKNPINLLH